MIETLIIMNNYDINIDYLMDSDDDNDNDNDINDYE